MDSDSAGVRRPGGRYLAWREHRWPGIGVEIARWEVDAPSEGLCRVPQHLVFVTFRGTTARTETQFDGQRRYRGADFPGAVSFIPAGQTRRAWHGRGAIDYATIRLDPACVRPAELGIRGRHELTGFTNRPDPFIHELARALRTQATDDECGALFADGAATVLGLHVYRHYSTTSALEPDRGTRLAGTRLRAVLSHIHEHLAADLRLQSLADVAGMDRYRFSRAFTRATGRTPHRYVTDRRVERASELLARSSLPIAEIAQLVGLSSQSHLTTVFRRALGTTPHAYRVARRQR